MKRRFSLGLVIALLVSAAAADAQSIDYWSKYASKLPIGSTVRVRTTDGHRITAVLAIVDDMGITIQPKTRRPEPPRHIAFDQLSQLEIKENVSKANAAAVGFVTGAGTFGILLLLFATTMWD